MRRWMLDVLTELIVSAALLLALWNLGAPQSGIPF